MSALLSGGEMKKLADMNLAYDFLAYSLTAHKRYGEEASRFILECILQRRIGHLTIVPQKVWYGEEPKGHGVRLDVYLDEEDMEIFRRRGLHVVTNPGSNTKLASGIAPISAYLEKGINVAIGTDGPASNNCLDMFREMFLVTGLAKLREKDASAVDAWEVLKMATVNGSKAMYLPDTDVLAPGKAADLIRIDLHQPNMQPINNIPKNLVYSGSKQNVKMTMIQGRILYENGQFTKDYDVEAIYRKANEIIDGLR